MQRRNRELWLALVAIIVISGLYTFVAIAEGGVPAAAEFFGHSLGILGFVLMLMTEFSYSLRKRSQSARWGRMAAWLQFHIFTGIVGPYLVLLHSSWKFNGLAGMVMLLTIAIVISGFIGRYIYTAVPRTADGIILEIEHMDRQIAAIDEKLLQWQGARPQTELPAWLQRIEVSLGGERTLVFGRALVDFGHQLTAWNQRRGMEKSAQKHINRWHQLAARRRDLERQVQTIAIARQLLSVWHTLHVPLGIFLFIAAFIHIIGAIYFATLIH